MSQQHNSRINRTKLEYYYQILKVIEIGECIKKRDLHIILRITSHDQLRLYLSNLIESGCIKLDKETHKQTPFILFYRITDLGRNILRQMETVNELYMTIDMDINPYKTDLWDLSKEKDVMKIRNYLKGKNENIKVGRKPKF